MERWDKEGPEWQETGDGIALVDLSPLGPPEARPDRRHPEPELLEDLRPAWQAYHWLLIWADGEGGLDQGTLENYFRPPNPGSRLEPSAERSVRRHVPWLIREERRLRREEAERKKLAAESRARRPG